MNIQRMIRTAMIQAAHRGFDPRNSHAAMERGFAQAWRLAAARESALQARDEWSERSSEQDANRYLSMFLVKQAG